jgi:hypothetical protein
MLPNKYVCLTLFDIEAVANDFSVNCNNGTPRSVQVRRYERGVSVKPNAWFRKNHPFPRKIACSDVGNKVVSFGNAAKAADDDPSVSEQRF